MSMLGAMPCLPGNAVRWGLQNAARQQSKLLQATVSVRQCRPANRQKNTSFGCSTGVLFVGVPAGVYEGDKHS